MLVTDGRCVQISINGIVALNDIPPESDSQRLDEMHIVGFAPYFGRMNTARGGAVYVAESTDSDVLTRATQTIGENYNEPGFVAKTVVSVTYVNVSTDRDVSISIVDSNVYAHRQIYATPSK